MSRSACLLATVLAGLSLAGRTAAGGEPRPDGALESLLRSIGDPREPLADVQLAQLRDVVRLDLSREWMAGNAKRLPCRLIVWMEAYARWGEASLVEKAIPLVDAMVDAAIPPEKAHVCPYTGRRTPYAFQTTGPVDLVGVAFNYAAMARVARTLAEHRTLHGLHVPARDGRPAATGLQRANAYLDRCRVVLDYFKKDSGWWNEAEKRWSYEKLKAGDRLSGDGGYVAFNRYLMFDLARWDAARALQALDPAANRAWIDEARDVVGSGIALWTRSLLFQDHPRGRYAIFPYRIGRRMEDTNHVGWDLIPLALFDDDGLDVGRANLQAVSNALVYVAFDETGRATRGIDGTATDGKGWRRSNFNPDCLILSRAAPDLFEQRARIRLEEIRETLKKDRLEAAFDLVHLLVCQARYLRGKAGSRP